MSPVKTVDNERKEELILGKQLRQSSTKMLRRNLPTLIEASPDFNQKKLPYLPNLPPSVQIPTDTGSTLHSWFEAKQDYSVCSDGSYIYSLPNKYRNRSRRDRSADCQSPGLNRPDSRRSRSSSITFDLELEDGSPKSSKHKKIRDREKEEKLDRRERRERRERAEKRDREEKKQKEERKAKEERKQREDKVSQAATFAQEDQGTLQRKKQETVTEEEYSMWSCRKCTLENRLEDSICQACGGSRLSSIGEVHLEDVEDAVHINIPQLPKEEELPVDWTCVVCTLTNPALVKFCDACNSVNPLLNDKDFAEAAAAGEAAAPERREQLERAARYIGLALFTALLLVFIINVILSIFTFARDSFTAVNLDSLTADLGSFKPTFQLPNIQQDTETTAAAYEIDFNFYGVNIMLFGCLMPFFLYHVASLK